jgi:cobalt-precorrin 5A hydrolase/precorrin-3B C17-methyltransferase
MKSGIVVFAGAGPGAPDLLTLRCRDAIAAADVIVYAGSLVNPEVLKVARPGCVIHDSAAMALPDIMEVLIGQARAGRKVLRLHTGDPSVYGAIGEQMTALRAAGVPYEVIPGVSSVFAAAAAVRAELTLPGHSQTVILTRRAGRTPVPAGQDIRSLAAHRATMAVFLSAGSMRSLTAELIEGGYAPETPAAVVYRASWPEERILRGDLATIAGRVESAGIGRQALLLVGGALSGEGELSRLYAPEFTHGWREAGVPGAEAAAPKAAGAVERTAAAGVAGTAFLSDEFFGGRVAVYALTRAGCDRAVQLAERLGGDAFLSARTAAPESPGTRFDPVALGDLIRAQWDRYEGHVFVMATGIVVRKIAPLIRDKTRDPAVVTCDETGQFAVSLLGGHLAGANRLARKVARAMGGEAVVSTATDAQRLPAFDEVAERQGWRIRNPEAIKVLNGLLLEGKPIALLAGAAAFAALYQDRHNVHAVAAGGVLPDDTRGVVVFGEVDTGSLEASGVALLRLARRPLALGIGCNRGTSVEDIEQAAREALAAAGMDLAQVRGVASVDLKQDEAGLLAFAARHGWTPVFHAAAALSAVPVPTPSAAVEEATGTPSVAEAAALLLGGGRLLAPKRKHGNVTVAVATWERRETGKVVAVGIGPGTPAGITGGAREAIRSADLIVGYKPYCEQVAWLTAGKRVQDSGMRDEVARCTAALEAAEAGQAVAVLSSGDAGVYGMAGLLLELRAGRRSRVEVEVVPGVTAASQAAAALGAPLMNDFVVISLSDLMTPRETIVARLRAVAATGLTCVLYNPRSMRRRELFEQALGIFADVRGGDVPAALVRHAGRTGESRWVGSLKALPVARVDMFTVVFIGGEGAEIQDGRLLTRRGYATRGGADE